MQKIWHKKRHNSTSTYRIKLVDPSLDLYFIVLSFRISIFAFLPFFADVSTFFSLFTIDDVIVFHLTCQYRTFPLKWWPEIVIWCYWYIIPTSDKVSSYLLYPINIYQPWCNNLLLQQKKKLFFREVPPTKPPVPHEDDPLISWNFVIIRLTGKFGGQLIITSWVNLEKPEGGRFDPPPREK